MKKRVLITILLMTLSLCFTACGSDDESGGREKKQSEKEDDKSDENEEKVGTEGNSESGNSQNSQEDSIPLTVHIHNDTSAEFVYEYEGNTLPTGCAVRFEEYEVSIINFGGEDYQSSLWTVNGDNMDLLEMVPYSIEGNKVHFDVDMSNYGGFSFYDIDIYECWCDYGDGSPYLPYEAEKVVKNGDYSDNNGADSDKTDDNSKDENASNSYYLEREFTDGISVICFHGTDPCNPTSMTINGKKITFDKVVVVENDDYYMHLSLGWETDGYNEGAMYYDKEADYMQLKGFAIANDYYPVDSSNDSSSNTSSSSFVGVPYTGYYGTIVVEAVDSKGLPTKMAFDDYHVTFENANVISNDPGFICVQYFWTGDDGNERQCEFNYIADADMIVLKMYYAGEYTR